MKIETALDLEKRTATVTIYTDDKSFKTTYDLDKVAQQLEALSTNWVALKILDMLGFKIEIQKGETKPSEPLEKLV